jgi:hypothetical protein
MNLCGGDRRRIDIPQGRNRLKGAQNNILRLKGSSLVSLTILYTIFCKKARQSGRKHTNFSHSSQFLFEK